MYYGGNNMIILKTILAFLLLLILARFLGKKQMSQMTFFHYVTGITIGSIAADIVITDNGSIIDEAIGLVLWCTLTALLAYGTLKSAKLRLLIDGQPTILIKNGILQKKSLKITRISMEELSMMLREQSIFSIEEVDYAILEPNGRLSVLKKQSNLSLTRADMDIPTSNPKYLPSQIIVDGKIVYQNLKPLGLSIEWLEKELDAQNISNIKDVFYAEIQSDGSLYIAPY
ncbi:DUF421 domain-containing protein [Tissierella sp. DSM 105185]|uniref:DUF421 domain-containing protein n=2 Tax=Tissierella pigra TaxID=2607614 RepID=A0A6N7XG57_9FIRM|nr:DUF421 domain-containing protein [Tissierella pigra]